MREAFLPPAPHPERSALKVSRALSIVDLVILEITAQRSSKLGGGKLSPQCDGPDYEEPTPQQVSTADEIIIIVFAYHSNGRRAERYRIAHAFHG